jgi:GMP synthase (glutamine-hydrolysing)
MPVAAVLVHQPDAGLGTVGDGLRAAGWDVVEHQIGDGAPFPSLDDTDALVVMGATANVDEEDRYGWIAPERALIRDALARELPLLGICFGAQILAEAAGGEAYRMARPEFGWIPLAIVAEDDPVLGDLPVGMTACVWHYYAAALPEGAVPLAHSPASLQAYRVGSSAWGIQFHPEVSETDLRAWMKKGERDFGVAGVTLERLDADTTERIGPWQDVGRAIGERFATTAATRTAARPSGAAT